MKIILFSQFYKPESIAAAFRAAENAKLWGENGHSVTVFTGYPNYPIGKIFEGYEPRLLTDQKDGQVRVLRSKLIAKPNTNMVRRLENALSYFAFALINILFNRHIINKDYDVVLATSGTVFSALVGWIYAKTHAIPFVLEIRDITYKQLIATGSPETSFRVKAMKKLEIYLCAQAKKVVVVTEGFKRILSSEGVLESKIDVIMNGVDVDFIDGFKDINDEEYFLSYFGTLGISQNIADTLRYAQMLSAMIPQFKYLIIGEGAQKEELKRVCTQPQYDFVKMLPGMSMEDLEEYYSQTQLSIVTLRKSNDFKDTIPSKIFQIMGRGKAILFIGPEGEAAELIRRYDTGIVLTKSVEEDLADLKAFFSDTDWHDRLCKMMENGRKAAKEHFSRSRLAKKYLSVLHECTKQV